MLRYLGELRSLPVAAGLRPALFIDTLTFLHFAVASFYVIVVLIAAHNHHRSGIVITGVTCAFLVPVGRASRFPMPWTHLSGARRD